MIIKYMDINENGHSIKGKLFCKDTNSIKEAVIVLHGYNGSKENKAIQRFAEHLIAKYKSFAVYTFDLPCHGTDVKRKLTLEDCDEYITLAMNFLKQRFKVDSFYGYANSFGAYLLLKYIHDHGMVFHKLILRCPALDMYQAFSNKMKKNGQYDILLKGKEAFLDIENNIKVNMDFIEGLKANNVLSFDYIDYCEDMLIIQGTMDEVIDYHLVNTFSEENIIELIPIEGADHRFRNSEHLDLAISHIIKFIKT